MKRYTMFVLGIVLACVAMATVASGATEQQKLDAINNGLAHLYATQLPNGSWSYQGYEQAATGAAVLAFVSQKDKWGANAANYQTAVDNAIAYLLSTASTSTVSTRNDGVNICPGGSGTCLGVFWDSNESTYITGLIAPALATYAAGHGGDVATATGPLANLTWTQIAQGIINQFAESQSTALNGNRNGGWRYYNYIQTGDADSSTTQWAIISMIYGQTLGATVPSVVKDNLKVWLGVVQAADGSGCYQPNTQPCEVSDTGSILLGFKFVGYDLNNAQVAGALTFLQNNWQGLANNTWYGNFGHPYAMWAAYKGLEVNIGLKDTTHITNLLTTCGAPNNLPGTPPGNTPCNWWEDYNQWLVTNQNVDGSWSGYSYWVDPLATAFYINILGATMIPVGNPVLDDFNRANGPVGPNWSGYTSINQYAIENNQVEPDGLNPIYWNQTKFGVNQEAFVTLVTIDRTGRENDLMLKVQGTGPAGISYKKGYIEVWYNPKTKTVTVATMLPNKTTWKLYPKLNVTFANGDKFGAQALANGEVHVLKNGADVGVVVLGTADQAFFNSRGGYIGLWFVSSPNAYFDDFGGGDL